MFDLDRFKEVNDTLGHQAGDQLLIEVARRLSDLATPDDVLARFAGDEFALCGERAGDDEIDVLVRACTGAIARPVRIDGLELVVQASAGVALRTPRDDAATLLRKADIAMYHAKVNHLGHDVYRGEIDRRTPARLSMLADLRAAIDGVELDLHFQPKLDLVANLVSGAEVLARWHHPTRGWVPPVEFVKVAEESGLIRSLTDLVLDGSIEAIAALDAPRPSAGHRDELVGPRSARRTARRPGRASPRAARCRPGSTHARDHRGHVVVRRATHTCHDRTAASHRRPSVDRRLRYRLLVAQLPAPAAGDRTEDRPQLRDATSSSMRRTKRSSGRRSTSDTTSDSRWSPRASRRTRSPIACARWGAMWHRASASADRCRSIS